MEDEIIYREVLSRGRRTFHLFQDRVVIDLRYPNRTAEFTVFLRDLRPLRNTVRVRDQLFVIGVLLLFGAFPLGGLYLSTSHGSDQYGYVIATAIVGMAICLYTFRKIEYASFVNQQGIVTLDVGNSGPDRSQFPLFVEELTRRIQSEQPS